jgi:uncharacterized membrane protein YhaH (DUF805 family)
MYCSNCGSEVKEGQAICLSCGFAIKGNTAKATKAAVGESDLDLSDRVKHNVFALVPTFNDGPVGRVEFLVKNLIMIGVMLPLGIFFAGVVGSAEGSAVLAPLAILVGLVFLGACVIMMVHQIALLYKRFWDIGIVEQGARIGAVVGFYIVSCIPLLNILTLVIWFLPPKR